PSDRPNVAGRQTIAAPSTHFWAPPDRATAYATHTQHMGLQPRNPNGRSSKQRQRPAGREAGSRAGGRAAAAPEQQDPAGPGPGAAGGARAGASPGAPR